MPVQDTALLGQHHGVDQQAEEAGGQDDPADLAYSVRRLCIREQRTQTSGN